MRHLSNPGALIIELEAQDSVIMSLRQRNRVLEEKLLETSTRAYKRLTDPNSGEDLEKARTIDYVAQTAASNDLRYRKRWPKKTFETVDDLARESGLLT